MVIVDLREPELFEEGESPMLENGYKDVANLDGGIVDVNRFPFLEESGFFFLGINHAYWVGCIV